MMIYLYLIGGSPASNDRRPVIPFSIVVFGTKLALTNLYVRLRLQSTAVKPQNEATN